MYVKKKIFMTRLLVVVGLGWGDKLVRCENLPYQAWLFPVNKSKLTEVLSVSSSQ